MIEYQKKYFYVIELASIIAFWVLALTLIQKAIVGMAENYGQVGWPVIFMATAAAGFGYLGADFASGMVHFLFDTFGSEKTPLVGAGFVKAFRVHHDDPQDITRHGFVATNGKNSLASLPVFILALVFLNFSNIWQLLIGIFITVLTLGVFGTNQFHKWAHTKDLKGVPLRLQQWGLILGPEHHATHHAAPHNSYFCITTGWLNPLLSKLRFFELIVWVFKKNSKDKFTN